MVLSRPCHSLIPHGLGKFAALFSSPHWDRRFVFRPCYPDLLLVFRSVPCQSANRNHQSNNQNRRGVALHPRLRRFCLNFSPCQRGALPTRRADIRTLGTLVSPQVVNVRVACRGWGGERILHDCPPAAQKKDKFAAIVWRKIQLPQTGL